MLQQMWHDKDPSLLKGPERQVLPFTGNGDVSIKVKES
jgi:hypothetical protein